MNLDKLIKLESTETRTEMVTVDTKLVFEMLDGKCVDETLQPLYDFVKPFEEVASMATDEEYTADHSELYQP